MAGLAPMASNVLAMISCRNHARVYVHDEACLPLETCPQRPGARKARRHASMPVQPQLTIDTKLVIHCIKGLLLLTASQSLQTESASVWSNIVATSLEKYANRACVLYEPVAILVSARRLEPCLHAEQRL